MKKIAASALEAEVRRLAAERPEYVYPSGRSGSCYYLPKFNKDNEQVCPSCLLGQALLNLGVERDFLFAHETGSIKYVLNDMRSRGRFDGEGKDFIWFVYVQIAQDDGIPWGEAVEVADHKKAKRGVIT